jgi:hypothetical protein
VKRMNRCSLAIVGLLVFLTTVSVANAQLRLVAQNDFQGETVISPEDPSLWPAAPIVSPEIFALDVPPIPSSGYVQFTSSAVWQVWYTPEIPTRANLFLRIELTSPSLPSSIMFAVPLAWYQNNSSSAQGFQGGTGVDSEVITRGILAKNLLAKDPGLTESMAKAMIDQLFKHGFHVSVKAQLRSQNVTDAVVMNSNVAFFAEHGSNKQPD